MISFTVNLYFLFSAVFVVEGTLTPDGTGPLDCGSQRSFTCSVSDAAAWNITGLSGISLPALPTGRLIADNNGRITSTDTGGVTQSSTITITGFSTADDGGTIQCININDASVQGMASISVGTPSCPIATAAVRSDDFTSATVSWQQPSNTPVTSTTVTYCPTSSPNCGDSMTCTSPCNISGLDPCMDYSFTVIPNNNCGSATGCTGNSKNVTSQGTPLCPSSVTVYAGADVVNVTWQQATLPQVTFTTVTYCPTSSPNCGNSMNCTTSPCTICGLDPGTEYQFTVIPKNICGVPTGCTGHNTTAETACFCSVLDPTSDTVLPTVLAGTIPSVISIVITIISVVVAVLITRHYYRNVAQKSSSKCQQVEEPSPYEDIPMTNSPAYGPVK